MHGPQLVRILADIDSLLAEAESLVEEDDPSRDVAIKLLIEFQERKCQIEHRLATEN